MERGNRGVGGGERNREGGQCEGWGGGGGGGDGDRGAEEGSGSKGDTERFTGLCFNQRR